MDRNKFAWMANNADSRSYFYGYSTTGNVISPASLKKVKGDGHDARKFQGEESVGATLYPGLGLNDYASYNWGFTDANLGISAHSTTSMLWTHADALCYLSPTTAPYTYDTIA